MSSDGTSRPTRRLRRSLSPAAPVAQAATRLASGVASGFAGRSVSGWSIALALLAVACRSSESRNTIEGTGTVEIVEVDVSPLTPGRVTRVLVDEGSAVRPGDTLAVLTQSTLGPDIEGRRARVAAAEASLRDLTAGARGAELERAAAELRAAEADAVRTERDLARLTPLAERQDVSQQQLDAARAAARTAAARRDAAAQALRLLQQGTRTERVRAARAEVEAARAALGAAEASARDLVLLAPIAGTVMGRHVEPGEILGAGEPALTVGDVRRPWVRIYVSPAALARVRVGARATATLDAFPDRPFAGRVASVNDRAEFTPRVALTEEERADLLFGVKVDLDDSSGMLKAGLPVTVRIEAASGERPAAKAARASSGLAYASRR
jgi:HlyD family secretion protein